MIPVEPKDSPWEKKVEELSQDLPPIPGAAPPEEPQVDEVVEED